MPQLQISSDYMPDSLTGHLSSVVISVMIKGFKDFIVKGLISLQFLFTALHAHVHTLTLLRKASE